jgi:hypothetical protein
MSIRSRKLLFAGLLATAAAGAILFIPPSGPRLLSEFDADRTASLEVDMWKAYYDRQPLMLFRLLTIQLREQYSYTWAKAIQAAFHLARAAATFGDLRGDYEQVLPDLERAYAIARDWTRANFDPAAVARAELAWWVARRTPGDNSPEQVGDDIARTYALLYARPLDSVAHAGLLRAQAAALRDAGGAHADWPAVASLLRDSYRNLHTALHPQS